MQDRNIYLEVAKFNQDAGTKLGRTHLTKDELKNEAAMLDEELGEFVAAINGMKIVKLNGVPNEIRINSLEDEREQMADALGDIIYVAMGTMAKLGFDYYEIMNEIIKSNKSKYQDGKLEKNMAGKIIKGPDFKEPDLSFVHKPVVFYNPNETPEPEFIHVD